MSSASEKIVPDSPPSEQQGDVKEIDEEFNGADINVRKLIRKIDWRLIPSVTILYLLSFLDRANVGNAKVEGLADAINSTTDQYLTGLTLFFVGYVVFEVPWNIVLKRTTPKFWLPTITVVWGIVAMSQGFVSSLAGFYAVRFFLGFVEGGLFPGVVFYLSMWYIRKERQFRVALFFSAAALAGTFGGILAYGIAFMDGVGGLGGWSWIFILEGILTSLVGVAGYFFIVNYPSTAKFLKPEERAFIEKRLADDSDVTEHEGFTWASVRASLADPKVWLYSWGYHFLSLPLYTIALFLPTIIEDLGYSAADAQLLTIPPYALAAFLTVFVAWVSERNGRRAPFIIGCMGLSIIGYAILISNKNITGRPGVSYVGVFFTAAGIYPAVALILSWPAINVSGPTKRAVANALQITIGNCGAVIGTQVYRGGFAPLYAQGHAVALSYCVVTVFLTSFTWWYLARENKKREAIEPGSGYTGGAAGLEGDDDPRWRFML